MASMAIADLDREAAARRNAATDHALRCLRGPSPNSINGPSNWVIALNMDLHGNVFGVSTCDNDPWD